MSKVGLCIVYKNWNYGSMLQSYATLLELEKLNVEYEIIRYERKKDVAFYVTSLHRLLLPDMRYSKIRSLKKKIGKKPTKVLHKMMPLEQGFLSSLGKIILIIFLLL